jgi:starch synthase
MKILFVSTEAEPFAKSGGLGDVIGSLPKELIKKGADARVVLPLYRHIRQCYSDQLTFLGEHTVSLSWRQLYCGLHTMTYQGVVFYFIDNEAYFDREAYYGYFDDGERFAYYAMAVLGMLKILDWCPDILHCHEWQTALVPIYLKDELAAEPFFQHFHTVFTIHNVEYQGQFDLGIAQDLFGISREHTFLISFNNQINLLKGAIACCDSLTTVSPTYAEELQEPYFAHKLDPVIRQYAYKLKGIINGIDQDKFNPATDPMIFCNYTLRGLKKKQANKDALRRQMGLSQVQEKPLIGMIGRLVAHKGIDLVAENIEFIISQGAQIIMLGTGDKTYEEFFIQKAKQYPDSVSVNIHFSPDLANQIYAGSDLFLMPSKSEPCGIAQMIALRYGTVPIVRETGGLKDSIKAFNPITKSGNGITFVDYDGTELQQAIRRGLALYKEEDNWQALVRNAFKSDFSWKQSAKAYMALYESLL